MLDLARKLDQVIQDLVQQNVEPLQGDNTGCHYIFLRLSVSFLSSSSKPAQWSSLGLKDLDGVLEAFIPRMDIFMQIL